MINPNVFKAYDIRGLANTEINEQFARRLGKTLVSLFHYKEIVVGRDMRALSPALEQALIEGCLAAGANVTKIGLCSTPVFNFAVGESNGKYDLGIMITASHNPSEYNGFKITKARCIPIGQGSGMEEIRDLMISNETLFDAPNAGSVKEDANIISRYLDLICTLASLPERIPKLQIPVDAGNGMAGIVLPQLKKRFPMIDFVPLYWDLDGTFPNHEANPLKTETLTKLSSTVEKLHAPFGVAFDGDADRVGLVDDNGTPIPGDLLGALLTKEIIKENNNKILIDVRSSWSAIDAIRAAGGDVSMCRVGHAHIKRCMREENAVFAAELSMHFYFSDLWNVESGDLVLLLILRLILQKKAPLSTLWKPLIKYASTGEVNFQVQNPQQMINEIEKQYQDQATSKSFIDGIRFEFKNIDDSTKDWWFSLRSSNTEPLLRLVLEARSKGVMEEKLVEIKELINK